VLPPVNRPPTRTRPGGGADAKAARRDRAGGAAAPSSPPRPDRPAQRQTKRVPARRHPADTRARILAAAWTEFADKGIGGARVDQIARRARTNKRMLYHYFGNKAALYLAVLERAYDLIRGHERDLALPGDDPVEGMRRLIAYNFAFCRDQPDFIRLLNTENLHKARHLARSPRARAVNLPVIETIGRLLDDGAARGVFRRGVDPLDLYISIAALGYFYFSNLHTLSAVFGRALAEPATIEARREHQVEVILGYLRP